MRKVISLGLTAILAVSSVMTAFGANNSPMVTGERTDGIVSLLNKENTTGIRGQFSQDLFSGSAGYSYSLAFPKGMRGVSMDMGLTYNSNQKDAGGAYGYGWDLNIPKIYRNSRKGVDRMYSLNEFIANGNELVSVGSGLYLGKNANDTTKYWFQDGKWKAIDGGGNTYIYGSVVTSKLADAKNPSKVFSWMLDSVIDPFGNHIDYMYTIDAGGNVYPNAIKYVFDASGSPLYEIRFKYVDKTRSITSYRTQFEVKSSKLVSEIASYVSGKEARKYVLKYDTLDSAYSHLLSIQEASGDKTLPSTNFTYGSGKLIHLLTQIDNGHGGIISLGYRPSTDYKDGVLMANAKLPMLMMTLSRIDYSDTITNQKSYETFEYSGGNFYYDAADLYGREYAGFHKAVSTDDTGRKKITYFHQSQKSIDDSAIGEFQDHISKKGKPFREEVLDGSGNVLQTKITKWLNIPKGNDRYLVVPDQVTSIMYNADLKSHTDAAESYQYDTYGNVTKKVTYGLVTADPKTGSFSDIGDDMREMDTSYAINVDKNMLSFPDVTTLLTGSGQLIAKSENFYDSLSDGLVGSGLVTEQRNWKDIDSFVATKSSYDTTGNPIAQTDPKGNVTTIAYDDYQLFPIVTTNPLGWKNYAVYDYALGTPVETTDPNGIKAKITYDSFGRELTKRVLVPGQSEVTFSLNTYDDSGKPNSVSSTMYFNAVGDDQRTSVTYYDGFGKGIQSRTEQYDAGMYSVSKVLYDTKGNKIFTPYPRSESGITYMNIDVAEKGDSYSYDALDRVISVKNATGEVKTVFDGLTTTTFNQKGVPIKYTSDANGNLVMVTETNSGTNYLTKYRYNGLNKLINIVDAKGNIRNFTYDMLGRVVTMEDLHKPDATSFGSIAFTYDDNGNVLSKLTQSGKSITKTYDSLNRVMTESYPFGSGSVVTNFGYDSGSFGTGKLVSVSKGDYVQSFGYNGFGQKTNESIAYGTDVYNFSYGYDIGGAVRSVTFPDGKIQTNGYVKGMAKNITFDGRTILSDIVYNPAGKTSKIVYGNGIVSDYAYDYDNGYRLIGKRSAKDGINYQSIRYTFDTVGNITQLKESGLPELQKTVDYTYDDLNRLLTANHTFPSVNAINEAYAYDELGNITSSPVISNAQYGGNTIGANSDALISASGIDYGYDEQGNIIQKTGSGLLANYEYNIKNEMMGYSDAKGKTNYMYDATGRRILKDGGDMSIQYVSKLLEVEKPKFSLQSSLPSKAHIASDVDTGSGVTESGGTAPDPTPTDSGTTSSGSVTPPDGNSGSTNAGTGAISSESGTTNIGSLSDSGATNSGATDSGTTSTGTTNNTGSTSSGGDTTGSGTSSSGSTSMGTTINAIPKWSRYIYLGNDKVATVEDVEGGTTRIILHLDDHLGGSNIDTSETGAVLQVTDYLPYGKERLIQQNSDYKNKYRFGGKEKDSESDLQYFVARYYDDNLGRFVEQDPVFWEIGQTDRGTSILQDPQQMNSYSYARNNPVVLTDPTGEIIEWRARPLDSRILGGTFDHSYIYIHPDDKNYKFLTSPIGDMTIGGHENANLVHINDISDSRTVDDGTMRVNPAKYGMTENQMIDKIIIAGYNLQSQDIPYSAYGLSPLGDGNNCHRVATTILNDAGVPLQDLRGFKTGKESPGVGKRVKSEGKQESGAGTILKSASNTALQKNNLINIKTSSTNSSSQQKNTVGKKEKK